MRRMRWRKLRQMFAKNERMSTEKKFEKNKK